MASMMYELKTGVCSEIPVDGGDLILPLIQTGNVDLDSLIENGWQGFFDSTASIPKQAELLSAEDHRESVL